VAKTRGDGYPVKDAPPDDDDDDDDDGLNKA